MHSPGTKKIFEWAHLFHPQPKLLLAAPAPFADLRENIFGLPPDKYYDQHLSRKGPKKGTAIKPSDDSLGFSGSQFFFSHDKALIIKSVPRAFESGFLLDQMLDAYTEHIRESYRTDPSDPNKPTYSLLTQITDVLYPPYHNVLGMLGIGGEGGVWIVMKNSLLLNPPGEQDKFIKATAEWDLKPPNFFEPTRDLIPDSLKSSTAKSGLADVHIPLKDRPVVSSQKRSELLDVLRRDTEFLDTMKVVDYSVLLGRWDRTSYPYPLGPEEDQKWSEGVESKDGNWIYRITLVDFLWSQKGGLRPRVTRVAGKAIPEQTISTEPDRYKDAVVGMCEKWILTESPSQEEVRREEEQEEQEEEEENQQ
ncbi:phosphatidylinositol-4-phosphate 5-kinase-domain-containing protein [Coprinopsis sp. MPI-PUGE-AT-0042]|nr:phosphatidylinositol-4-phosphate 5-kinase-domain-containing protein [Coprinopsis sp. MPI-PUGE-AT-0042]